MNVDKLKYKIMEIIHEKPRLCKRITLQWLSTSNGLSKFSEISNLLDNEVAKLMMDWIPSEVWLKLEKLSLTHTSQTAISAQEFIQIVISSQLTWDESKDDLEDPFQAIKTLTKENLNAILTQFKIEEWALTSAFWERDELLRFAQEFQASDRRSFVMALERLKKIPKDSMISTAKSFANRVNLAIEGQKPVIKSTAAPKEKAEVVFAEESKVEEAIQEFVDLNQKETEIELQISEFLESVDPELNAKLSKILNNEL